MDSETDFICVLCGRPWVPAVKNRCECGGFCTWGRAMGKPDSWDVTKDGKWVPKPPPVDTSETQES